MQNVLLSLRNLKLRFVLIYLSGLMLMRKFEKRDKVLAASIQNITEIQQNMQTNQTELRKEYDQNTRMRVFEFALKVIKVQNENFKKIISTELWVFKHLRRIQQQRQQYQKKQ
ncbi:unnamed protein product (macronuclear) [Paramecium tetraurelia]|uniref:Uncharacterized protein n=1 Tax=Paramecium tetraurelia TaxID=5888 RepID=A0DC66_PARTE|nr:uncharacterized protein GSPATT00015510001 [Paramecium tetraurelia]CAK80633.1 unnamed protein product [Paramecium tetraurelia]|eukprot:XP_001448030.1 hypothetical protein (macronuclear) [Paramecium tetraurelia strain d4-2]